ncbi:hypothetical protein C2G38_2111258 [Gigaspora rosea]|uniref:Uncharacterized protein n=1 Tax=Gigaspora rosea TaxID=44941 RepID=A0A397UDX8_9GLOM|nr:hypothetical protein C2G38_2111258 [Gigaspora rosea]
MIYDKMGKYEKSLSDFHKAVEIDPNNEALDNQIRQTLKKIEKHSPILNCAIVLD